MVHIIKIFKKKKDVWTQTRSGRSHVRTEAGTPVTVLCASTKTASKPPEPVRAWDTCSAPLSAGSSPADASISPLAPSVHVATAALGH